MSKFFLVFCFVAMWAMVNGKRTLQAHPQPTMQCTTNLFMDLISCVDFVSDGSKVANPSIQCCSDLEKIVNVARSCVCQAFNFAKGFGIAVNMTKAQQLPSLCGFSIDIHCAEFGSPSPVPSKPLPPSNLAPPKSSPLPTPSAPVIPPKPSLPKSSPPVPSPTMQCTTNLFMDLIGCVDFVSDGSNVANPSIRCCGDLEKIVNVVPSCVCRAFNFAKGFGIAVNMTKAQQLPSLCGFSTDIHCAELGPPSPVLSKPFPPSHLVPPKSSPSPTPSALVIPPKPSPLPKSSPSAPSPTLQCTTNLFMDLIGCVDFVSDGSKVVNPSIRCCGGLEKIVNVAPSCVCQAFNFAKGFGIAVNMTKAEQLPSLCGFSTDIHCAVPSKPLPPSNLAPPKSLPSPTPSAPVIPPKPSPLPKSSPLAPSPTMQCTTNLFMDLIGCVNFVSDGSKVVNPSTGCCGGLEKIVNVAPSCVCQAFNFAKHFGIAVNMTKAQQLPSLCGFSIDIHCVVPLKPLPPSNLAPPKSSPSPTPSAPVIPPKPSPLPKSSPPAPSPTMQCTTNRFMDLIGCVDFVSVGSKVANPSIRCCGGLEKIVNLAPSCVCQAFNFAKGFGIAVNMTKAQQLPSLCGFSTDIHCAVPSKP